MSLTPVYGLRKFDTGDPVRDTATIINQHADTVETALANAGIPPADLPALIAAGWFTDTGWTALNLVNSWTGGFAPSVRRRGGWVTFKGEIWGGTAGVGAFTIPVNYRPQTRIFTKLQASAGSVETWCTIDTTGVVTLATTKAASPGFTLGAIPPFIAA